MSIEEKTNPQGILTQWSMFIQEFFLGCSDLRQLRIVSLFFSWYKVRISLQSSIAKTMATTTINHNFKHKKL